VARSDGRVKKYHLPLRVLHLETGGELILEKTPSLFLGKEARSDGRVKKIPPPPYGYSSWKQEES